MFRRKLAALEYVNTESFNIKDEKQVRSLVLWLEDQKIRQYKIEDRDGLRKIDSEEWTKYFQKYLADIACPFPSAKLVDQLEWLIGYAVNLEYSDNVEKFSQITSSSIQKNKVNVPKIVSSNPLDSLDFESEEFKNGVEALARIVNVKCHPDHLITLQAVSKLICDRLNADALQNPGSVVPKGHPFPFMESDFGFNSGNKVLIEAGKILRLLFIHDLRRLQTEINECIVSVQKVTANPKTDTKLGKVGY